MLTQKQIKQARIENQELFKNPERYALRKLVGRLNLAYLKALEQAIDTIILNKTMFKDDNFLVQNKELNMFVSVDTIALQELLHGRITGVGYRTLVEEFDLQPINWVDKALIDYDRRSSLHTELSYVESTNALIGMNVKLPERK